MVLHTIWDWLKHVTMRISKESYILWNTNGKVYAQGSIPGFKERGRTRFAPVLFNLLGRERSRSILSKRYRVDASCQKIEAMLPKVVCGGGD